MKDYRLHLNEQVVRAVDGAFIPPDPDNVDRIAYDAWLVGGGVPDPYVPPPPPVPATISRRQFFQQLAITGMISESEAKAALKTGDLPELLQGFLSALPAENQFAAEMLLSGAAEFQRAHELTAAIGAAHSMTSDQIDDFFRSAAAL